MAKSKAKPVEHKVHVEVDHHEEAPEIGNESQDHDDEDFASSNGHGVDKGNKASLVRAALAEGHTKPREGCRWIKETFGVEIEGTYFSVAKSQQAKRSGEAPSARSAASAAQPRSVSAGFSPVGVPAGFGSDVKAIRGLLADHDNEPDALKDLIATVDSLVGKYGVSGLNEMIDAFAE